MEKKRPFLILIRDNHQRWFSLALMHFKRENTDYVLTTDPISYALSYISNLTVNTPTADTPPTGVIPAPGLGSTPRATDELKM